MKEYIIKEIERDGYNRFLLWLSAESILDHLSSIEDSLNMANTTGKVLIDQLFITGDNMNRFMSCEFKNGKFDFRTARIVYPTEYFRMETTEWLKKNYRYVENSILTETQRKMFEME